MFVFDKPISGEAYNFDPTILVPFGGVGKGLSSLVNPVAKTGKGFLDDILKFFTPKKTGVIGAGAGAGAVTIPRIGLPSVGAGTKVLVGTGIVGGTAVGLSGINFLSTPGGQELANQSLGIAKDITGLTANTGKFFQENPLILVGLLAIGAIVVLKK